MIRRGDVISYLEMCTEEGTNLQRGMNFRLRDDHSVFLMSLRPNAPYADRIEEDGMVLVYEGHDISARRGGPDPKMVDQPLYKPGGSLTQNGLFYEAAMDYRDGSGSPERVKVYEKLLRGIWVYNGLFELIDAWQESAEARRVFKFKLRLLEDISLDYERTAYDLSHDRLIPTSVKLEVWRRDGGRCVECGSQNNLHFDHIIPYSKGGSSLVAENVQLLCARHNLLKSDKIT
jgi:hypothetical protein